MQNRDQTAATIHSSGRQICNQPRNDCADPEKTLLYRSLVIAAFVIIAYTCHLTNPELALAAALIGSLTLLVSVVQALAERSRARAQRLYAIAQTELLDRILLLAPNSGESTPKPDPATQLEAPTSINGQQLEELLARYDQLEANYLAATEEVVAA